MKQPYSPLRKRRLERELNLYQVAIAVGVDNGHLSRIERYGRASADLAEKLVKFLGGGLDELQVIYPERYVTAPGKKRKKSPAR